MKHLVLELVAQDTYSLCQRLDEELVKQLRLELAEAV